MALLFLFDPEPHIQYMVQRIFPHDLLYTEGIVAGLPEIELAAYRCQRYPMFINIVHTTGQPAFIVSGQAKVILSGLGTIGAGLFCIELDINIIEAVLIIMSQDQKKLVGR